MNYQEQNISVLVQRWPGWEKELRAMVAGSDFIPVQTPSGNPSGRYRGLLIHSAYDPIKEAKKNIPASIAAPHLVVGGFGLGYGAEALAEAYPNKDILLVEPDLGLFAWALKMRDLTKLLGSPRVHFMVGVNPALVTTFLAAFPDQPPLYWGVRAQVQGHPQYFDELQQEINSYYLMKEVNQNTLKKHQKRWLGNFFANLPFLPFLRPLVSFKNYHKGFPGVVVAAGPSLEGSLNEIKTYRDKIVLIAVDTAYNRLKIEGLTPDYLVSTDGQYWNSRHLDKLEGPLPLLVGELTTPSRFWRGREHRGILLSSHFPFLADLENLWGLKLGSLPSGGSVATTAWGLGKYLGLEPLIFSGLDLAYPREETHIRGSMFEELSHAHATKLRPAATSLSHLGDVASVLWRKDWAGNPIRTDVRMDLYRQWFESQCQDPLGGITWILSPQGQTIQGFLPLQSLSLKIKETQPSPIFKELSEIEPLGPSNRLEKLVARVSKALHSKGGATEITKLFPQSVQKINKGSKESGPLVGIIETFLELSKNNYTK